MLGAPRNVSAGTGRRRELVCARAASATQPVGCGLGEWLLLLITASTCKHVRSGGTAPRRGRFARDFGRASGRRVASIGGKSRQPYCAGKQNSLGCEGKPIGNHELEDALPPADRPRVRRARG